MDGIANVARQQQSQVSSPEAQGRATQQVQQQVQQAPKVDVVKEIQKESVQSSQKIDSKEQVQDLVDQLSDAEQILWQPGPSLMDLHASEHDTRWLDALPDTAEKLIDRQVKHIMAMKEKV